MQNAKKALIILLLITPIVLVLINELIWGIYSRDSRIFFELLNFFLTLVALILSLIFLFRQTRKNRLVASLPVIFNVLLLFVLFNFDIQAYSRNRDFRRNLEPRESVVQMIRSSALAGRGSLKVPKRYRDKSVTYVEYARSKDFIEYILFIIRDGGALGGYAGFLYTEKNTLSGEPIDRLVGNDTVVIKMKDNWYWIEDH